jgi:hypothetical protein
LETSPPKRKAGRATSSAEPSAAGPTFSVSDLDDWRTDDQLRHIERVLNFHHKRPGRSSESSTVRQFRVDSAHDDFGVRKGANSNRPKTSKLKLDDSAPKGSPLLSFLTWTAIVLGTAALVGGGILLGYSILENRPDVWNIGLPLVIGGQIVLLIGLAMQLDRVCRDHRAAATKLGEVDRELHDLKTATAILETERNPRAGAFYAHFADGANPHLLLADLKGQLDLLAVKIASGDE